MTVDKTTDDAREIIARVALERPGPFRRAHRKRRDTARVTAWHASGPITGQWHAINVVQFAWQYYEYHRGVAATVEYAP